MPVSELNCLELEFLKLNEFNLTVPISELQKYGDQLLKVGYMTQQPKFRHHRSSSLDQTRTDFDRVCDLTQRMSLDEPQQQQQQGYYQKQHYYHPPQHRHQQVRRMTSTNSLNSTTSLNSNSRLSMSSSSSSCYEQPRHSRSSVNLHQGFWKPSSPSVQQQDTNRRLSFTSIHAPPFIPSSELQQQYYYPIGIPTPPPSASPIHCQQSQPNGNSTSNTTAYPTMFL